jgi:hypothetical protein
MEIFGMERTIESGDEWTGGVKRYSPGRKSSMPSKYGEIRWERGRVDSGFGKRRN